MVLSERTETRLDSHKPEIELQTETKVPTRQEQEVKETKIPEGNFDSLLA